MSKELRMHTSGVALVFRAAMGMTDGARDERRQIVDAPADEPRSRRRTRRSARRNSGEGH
jgi:hypothetical protein